MSEKHLGIVQNMLAIVADDRQNLSIGVVAGPLEEIVAKVNEIRYFASANRYISEAAARLGVESNLFKDFAGLVVRLLPEMALKRLDQSNGGLQVDLHREIKHTTETVRTIVQLRFPSLPYSATPAAPSDRPAATATFGLGHLSYHQSGLRLDNYARHEKLSIQLLDATDPQKIVTEMLSVDLYATDALNTKSSPSASPKEGGDERIFCSLSSAEFREMADRLQVSAESVLLLFLVLVAAPLSRFDPFSLFSIVNAQVGLTAADARPEESASPAVSAPEPQKEDNEKEAEEALPPLEDNPLEDEAVATPTPEKE